MKNQYEQHCNAAALKNMGIPVLKSLKKKYLDKIKSWIQSSNVVAVDYPDTTEQIIDSIFKNHAENENAYLQLARKTYSLKKFKKISLKKILAQIAG